ITVKELNAREAEAAISNSIGAIAQRNASSWRAGRKVLCNDRLSRIYATGLPLVQHDRAFRKSLNRSEIVAHEQNSTAAALCYFRIFTKTLGMKRCIPDRQYLINNKDFRLQVRGNGKCQPDIHAAAVALHGRIKKPIHLREGDNLIKLLSNFLLGHPQNSAV